MYTYIFILGRRGRDLRTELGRTREGLMEYYYNVYKYIYIYIHIYIYIYI